MSWVITPQNNVIATGLQLYLDAGKTTSYPGSGTTWTDLSGNSNNGTLVNGPTYSPSNNGSIVFDGTNDYVDLGTGLSQSGSWSIAVAFRPTRLSVAQALLTRTNGASSFNQNYGMSLTSANRLQVGSSADSYTYVLGPTVSINTWYYAVGTFNSSTKRLALYLNDSQVNSAVLTVSSTPTTGTQYAQLAAVDGTSRAQPFQGNISVAQIYNTALTPGEVLVNYNVFRGRYGI